MTRIVAVFVAVAVFSLVLAGGCTFYKELVGVDLDADTISHIQVVLAMGNPLYGADSKTITDRSEIESLVDALNQASVGKKVGDADLAVSDASRYYLYSQTTLVREFVFNGNDTERVWYRGGWRYVIYPGQNPYQIYRDSAAEVMVVDENLEQIERPD